MLKAFSVAILAACAQCAAASIISNPALNSVDWCPAPAHAPIALVTNGVPCFTLVWDSAREINVDVGNRYRPIREAVRTLRRELGYCTGTEIRVVDLATKSAISVDVRSSAQILVGASSLTDALGIIPARLPREGFIVTTFSNGVAIVGNDSSTDPSFHTADPLFQKGPRSSTLWGAYDFLERFYGCRYYYPGPDGCIRPVCTNLTISPCTYRDAPRFCNRAWGTTRFALDDARRTLGCSLAAAHLENWRAASRVACTEPFSGRHSPDPIGWAKAHPDLIETSFFRTPYGLLLQSHDTHYSNYFNIVNLEFADALVDGCKRFYATGGAVRQGLRANGYYVSFGQCDVFCSLSSLWNNETVQREELISADNLLLGPYGYFSDIYARFYLHLATRLKAELPDKKLILMPYAGCTYAPVQERFHHLPDNVELCICLPKIPRYIRNPAVRKLYVEQMKRWSGAIDNRPVQQIWTYNCCNSCFDQAVANEFLPEVITAFGSTLGNMELIVDLGLYPSPVPGYVTPFYFYYETYCAVRTLWDGADFNPDVALDEHWPLFYGIEAGAHLREAHRLIKEAYLAISAPAAKVQMLYPPKTLDAIEAELVAAEKILSADRTTPAWRRYVLMSQPLKYEIDEQRARHERADGGRRSVLLFVGGEDYQPGQGR